jgi:hypothetical protein
MDMLGGLAHGALRRATDNGISPDKKRESFRVFNVLSETQI